MCKQTAIKLFCMEQHNESHYGNCGGQECVSSLYPMFDTGFHKHIICELNGHSSAVVCHETCFSVCVCINVGAFECVK